MERSHPGPRTFLQTLRDARPAAGELFFWWLGQSGFLVKTSTLSLVVDPYLSTTLEDATRDQDWKRHIRMMDIPIQPSLLGGIDYILLSHAHRDHYDPESVSGIRQASPQCAIIAPRTLVPRLEAEQGGRIVGLDDGMEWRDGDLSIVGVRAKHNDYDHQEGLGYPYLSYAVSLCGHTLFFAGDTVDHEALRSFLGDCGPELAFLPINGYTQELIEKGFASNLNFSEAVAVAKGARVGITVPCHYDMFTINTEQVGRFVNEANRRRLRYLIPTLFDTFVLQAGGTATWK